MVAICLNSNAPFGTNEDLFLGQIAVMGGGWEPKFGPQLEKELKPFKENGSYCCIICYTVLSIGPQRYSHYFFLDIGRCVVTRFF